MICPSIHQLNFWWAASSIREQEALTMQNREVKGYSAAWLHHKGRNRHHYEYWLDYSTDPNEGIIGMKMPVRYVVEMFIDRVAASKNYMKEKYTDQAPLEYYEKGAARLGKMIHPETAELLHQLLKMLAEEGEEKTCSYIRKYVLKNKEVECEAFP